MTKMNDLTTLANVLLAIALTGLTACDFGEKGDFRGERESPVYLSAMADYKSGRIEQAIAGFRKACREDPANSSARFQLACLLQDNGRDYVDALCSYREFLLLQPNSDKSRLAKDRAAICELEAAKVLAEKHGLTNIGTINSQLETVQKKLKDAERRNVKLSDDVAVAMQRVSHLLTENARLKAALKGGPAEVGIASAAGLKDAKALLEEDEGDRMTIPAEVKRMRNEREETAVTDRIATSADIAALRRDADADADLAEKPLLPKHDPNAERKEFRTRPEVPAAPSEPPHEKRPATYVVQEGDTLTRIALRFYGRKNAWKLIREANKATISVDGRVDKGLRIRLPDPQ